MTKPITFIAVDGHGGSGKSTFAEELSQHLSVEVIHIDDFTGMGASDDWYKTIISKVINPIQTGAQTLSYPRAKWWPEHSPLPVENQAVTPVMIIEGVGSARLELRNFISTIVLVDTPRNICIERGLKRDKGMGGKSDEEVLSQWNQWLDWDDQYFAKHEPQKVADFIVNGTEPHELAITAISNKLKEGR